MSLKSLSNFTSTTTWRTHSTNKDNIFNSVEWLFFALSIIPTMMIHPLSQKFKRRLCSIFFFFRHIHIINEDYEFLSYWWSKDSLSSLFKFIIKVILSLIC